MNKEVVKARATEKARIFNMKVVQWYIAVLKGLMILTNASVLRFQNGNKKLKDGNGIAFIIFSLPAVHFLSGGRSVGEFFFCSYAFPFLLLLRGIEGGRPPHKRLKSVTK